MNQFTVNGAIGFCTLPREVRNIVYKMLLLEDGPISTNGLGLTHITQSLPLLFMNRQIYAEAVETLYGLNTFQFRPSRKLFLGSELLSLDVRAIPLASPISTTNMEYESSLGSLVWSELLPSDGICRARLCIRKLRITAFGMSMGDLNHICSKLKGFPALMQLTLVYPGGDLKDEEVIRLCRHQKGLLPKLRIITLGKRISDLQVDDLSWMVEEKVEEARCAEWQSVVDWRGVDRTIFGGLWRKSSGEERRARLLDTVPQHLLDKLIDDH